MNVRTTSLQTLVALCHHRWNIPLIAELHRLAGAKFITLVNRLQISRDSLSRTLVALLEDGRVQHNAGYGHPLRPEYVLTTQGQEVGPACATLMNTLRTLGVEDVALNKWSLPAVRCLGAGTARFGRLKAHLPGITARALAQTLKQLEDGGLVERAGDGYGLTKRAQRLGGALEALCAALDAND